MSLRRFAQGFAAALGLAAAGLGAFWLAVRLGLVSPGLEFLPPPDLSDPPPPFIADLHFSRLDSDAELCRRAVVENAAVEASLIPPREIADGCGWRTAVDLDRVAGATVGVRPLQCGAAGAFAIWMMLDVQPAALSRFGSPVRSVRTLGTYSCRNIGGSSRRSQHATANAVDVAGFTLADGRKISVLSDWGEGENGAFLAEVFEGACRWFRVALGPDYNSAHRDHLHFDRGPYSACR